MNLNHEVGESVQLANDAGRGVPVVPDAANSNIELSRALLKIYSVVTGLEVVKLPAEIIERWAAEESSGSYTMGVPSRDTRTALALIVGAGRFLVNGKEVLDRMIVVELLQEALKLLPPEIPENE